MARKRSRSRSPRRVPEPSVGGEGGFRRSWRDNDQPSVLDDGRKLAALLAMPRPQGLLKQRAAQLAKCGLPLQRSRWGFFQVLRQGFQRLCGAAPPPRLPAAEKAARILLACWAAVCSWDPGSIASQAWDQVSREACALDLVLPLLEEVSSIFGLFALLQVVEMAAESEDQRAVRGAVMKRMLSRLRAAGATCPVCLEELGKDPGVPLIVMPCGHAVHFSCYESGVRAKACAGRCLMCRKVCNWSNIIISKLRQDFGGWMLSMVTEEACALAESGSPLEMPPPEFVLASIGADLSEHLPYLVEVSMTPWILTRLFKANAIEISPQGSWMVTEKLDLPNAHGRGTLAGPGDEQVVPRLPFMVTLPVASTLVSLATVDSKVSYNEFQLHDAAAFTPQNLFGMLGHPETIVTTWKVPLPMKLFWTDKLRESLKSAGFSLCEAMVIELLERPELEIYGRLAMFDDDSDEEDSLTES